MKKILLLTLAIMLLVIVCEAEQEDNLITNSTDYITMDKWDVASKVIFAEDDYEYIIDAAGFRSLTNEEAVKLAIAIELGGKLLSDDLRMAIYEKFVPKRFKVKKEVK